MYQFKTVGLSGLNEQAEQELIEKIHNLELCYHATEPSKEDTIGFIFHRKGEVEMFATFAETEQGETIAYSLFFFDKTEHGTVHYRWSTYIMDNHRHGGLYTEILKQSEKLHKEKGVKFVCFKTQNPRVYITITNWVEKFCGFTELMPNIKKNAPTPETRDITFRYTTARKIELLLQNVVYVPHDYGNFSKSVIESHAHKDVAVESWFKELFNVTDLTQNHPYAIQVVMKL